MQSKAKTVDEYLDELPDERRNALEKIREVILENLPEGYEEGMQYGMIGYYVPLSTYPKGYLNKKNVPLPYVSLASQKNHMALYMMHIYGDKEWEKWFRGAYKSSEKKLDMGKSCIRFKKLEDLPLDVIGKAVALASVDKLINRYEAARKK
ncbi:MAG TPA: DUF1801 domain-containing protein [Verrucomicrobiae bacterium]|nr:DUF1801 domain-containing protein [Verrucomicrobiae bacterium]